VFIFPREKVAQLYLQALDSLFITSYDSQDYGGGIRSRLQEGISTNYILVLLITSQLEPHRKHRFQLLLYPIVAFVETCLFVCLFHGRFLATGLHAIVLTQKRGEY
jgi:hypothetical protein